jgi:DNA repair exonuclease SbcCD ATPase subunit
MGLGFALTLFLGGQIAYNWYRLHNKTQKIQAKKTDLNSQKKRLEEMERDKYEATIRDLRAEVEKYKNKYKDAKERLKNQGGIVAAPA